MKFFIYNPFFILVFLAFEASAFQPNPYPQPPFSCSNPEPDDCSFYKNCLGKKCGFNGYQKDYGYKYCLKFAKAKHKFSKAGQEWVTGTMLCLQQSLVEVYNDGSCSKIKDVGFSTHANCYVQNGLKSVCTIPEDWNIIIGVVNFVDIFGSVEAIKEALKTSTLCYELYFRIIKTISKKYFNDMIELIILIIV